MLALDDLTHPRLDLRAEGIVLALEVKQGDVHGGKDEE